jgi:hypothetical protein
MQQQKRIEQATPKPAVRSLVDAVNRTSSFVLRTPSPPGSPITEGSSTPKRRTASASRLVKSKSEADKAPSEQVQVPSNKLHTLGAFMVRKTVNVAGIMDIAPLTVLVNSPVERVYDAFVKNLKLRYKTDLQM